MSDSEEGMDEAASDIEVEMNEAASDSEVEMDEAASHAAALKRLKSKDPDFYKFLNENEKSLLNFEESVCEKSEDDESDEEDVDEFEVDEEESEAIDPEKILSLKEQIRDTPTAKLCKDLILSFKAVVCQSVGLSNKVDMSKSEFFNDIIKLCLIDLVPALYKVLNLSASDKKSVDPTKSKAWKKVQTHVKKYLIDMLKVISIMKESSVIVPILKHVVHLIPFYSVSKLLIKNLLKRVISLWSGEEETVRVLALIIIIRATKKLPKEHHGQVLKEMYFAYIKNTKFTSPSTWPMINFMKRSLTEIYSLNLEIAYEHAFIYIRQMSIHLRNAITIKQKEAFQTVYNWQYTHCILLWSHLLCRFVEHEPLKSLIYPLVQTTIGVINLIPTDKYIPLRFHLARALMHISESTGIFIPVLPLILDVLKIVDFNKNSRFSIRPVDLSCALKVTKAQQQEAGFKDSCIFDLCSLVVDYLKCYSNSIGFPELALPVVMQFKSFMKQCKVSKYKQQLKTVLLKIEENSLFISEKRKLVSFSITDNGQVKKWEEDVHTEGTPLMQFKKEARKVVEVVMDMPLKKKRKHS
ncbi:nucleolar complex protein 2 homolog [Trichonephila inaurata madagascariensis]|uniref:Nucleolar complex protein 2 homolog n=1 Tax=Trichonephila inaurata madagascariensis TaxID=2747483 RepID=A0A8X7BZZ9_9ARAC|nr:nucleolar complex protein 2 homolog [Trichonephila inaurata madagascariensis]